jgi:hypothetical protein
MIKNDPPNGLEPFLGFGATAGFTSSFGFGLHVNADFLKLIKHFALK